MFLKRKTSKLTKNNSEIISSKRPMAQFVFPVYLLNFMHVCNFFFPHNFVRCTSCSQEAAISFQTVFQDNNCISTEEFCMFLNDIRLLSHSRSHTATVTAAVTRPQSQPLTRLRDCCKWWPSVETLPRPHYDFSFCNWPADNVIIKGREGSW